MIISVYLIAIFLNILENTLINNKDRQRDFNPALLTYLYYPTISAIK